MLGMHWEAKRLREELAEIKKPGIAAGLPISCGSYTDPLKYPQRPILVQSKSVKC